MSSPNALLRERILFRRIVDEGLLLDLDTDLAFRLNQVGTRIVELLGEGKDVESLERRLCAEFSIDEDQCAQEVGRFLEQLKSKRLIDTH